MKKWTQNEAIAYECACETINDLMAILSGQIADESVKPHPDAVRLEKLHTERLRLARERNGLRVDDHEHVDRICTEYGAIVRTWRANHQAVTGKSGRK